MPPNEPATPEMYGTMPGELPSEIPAGTPIAWDGKLVATGTIRLVSGFYIGPSEDKSTGFTSNPKARYKPVDLDWTRIPKSSPSQKAAEDEYVQRCVQCGRAHGNGALCPFCADSGKPLGPEQQSSDPYAGYDLNAWGITNESLGLTASDSYTNWPIGAARPQDGIFCGYCGNPGRGAHDCKRAPKPYGPACLECGQETTRVNHAGEPSCVDCQCMVADEILGKGPANEPIDRRIASARQSSEREAGVKRFDAWVSCRHARTVK